MLTDARAALAGCSTRADCRRARACGAFLEATLPDTGSGFARAFGGMQAPVSTQPRTDPAVALSSRSPFFGLRSLRRSFWRCDMRCPAEEGLVAGASAEAAPAGQETA